MGIIKSTVKVGQKPSKEEMKRIRAELKEASKHPIVYTDDCPKSTPEALKKFAMQRAEMNQNDIQFDDFVNCHKKVPNIIERNMANTYIMVDAFGNLIDTGSGKNTPVANLLNTGFNEAFARMKFDYETYMVRYAA